GGGLAVRLTDRAVVVARQGRAEVRQLSPDLVGELLADDELDALEDALRSLERRALSGSRAGARVRVGRIFRAVAAAVEARSSGVLKLCLQGGAGGSGARILNGAGHAGRLRVQVAPVFDGAPERAIGALQPDREGRIDRLLDADRELILVGGLEPRIG